MSFSHSLTSRRFQSINCFDIHELIFHNSVSGEECQWIECFDNVICGWGRLQIYYTHKSEEFKNLIPPHTYSLITNLLWRILRWLSWRWHGYNRIVTFRLFSHNRGFSFTDTIVRRGWHRECGFFVGSVTCRFRSNNLLFGAGEVLGWFCDVIVCRWLVFFDNMFEFTATKVATATEATTTITPSDNTTKDHETFTPTAAQQKVGLHVL